MNSHRVIYITNALLCMYFVINIPNYNSNLSNIWYDSITTVQKHKSKRKRANMKNRKQNLQM